MQAVYIHIPFCRKICTYCDFCKMVAVQKNIKLYLEALKKEIEEKYENEKLKTIYIGGGTPSCLSDEDLDYLFDITKKLKLKEKYEFTFECNLEDINENLLTKLKTNKVNRLSIGIQSFDEDKLKFMGRNHLEEDYKKAMTLARKLGFNNINIDLMYGIPDETLKILKQDIKKILKYKPEHISTYSLIIEEHTLLSVNKHKPIDDELDLKMYETIIKTLTKKEYIHYEISNFSKSGYESIHNTTYWKNNEYYGFGLGAHGYAHGVRYENTRSLTKYLEGFYKKEESLLSKREMMENELMLGFRLLKGISFKEFFSKYKENLQDVFPIKQLVETGDLIFKNGYLKIPENKLYLMNEILLKIF